jgi:diguanylate cyclase (GGDEF)-like protein
MADSKNNWVRFSAMLLVICIALFTVISIVLYFVEGNHIKEKRDELERSMSKSVEVQSSSLGREFDSILSDLNFMFHNHSHDITNDENFDRIELEWCSLSKSREIYDQIRYINENGDEKICINFRDGEAEVVKSSQLENKKDHYYFFETINLKQGQVYISKLDLNLDQGKVEQPVKPMIRYSTPVYDNEDQFKGAFVINCLAESMLDEFRNIADVTEGQIFLLNSDGYYLSSNDKSEEWGFMYEDGENMNFERNHKDAWAKMVDKRGIIEMESGLYAYSNIGLTDEFKINSSYVDSNNVIFDDSNFVAVVYVDAQGEYKDILSKGFFKRMQVIIKKYLFYYLSAFLIAIILAVFLHVDSKSREKIIYFSKYDSMTDTFNRRAGFEEIKKKLPINSKRRSKMCLMFIDIDGLKQVNDTFGHKSGDELIITVANVVKHIIRGDDFIIRMGGDEFIIVLIDTIIQECEIVWNRITNQFDQINESGKHKYNVSASHGSIAFDEYMGLSIDEVIKIADDRMYEEKRATKENTENGSDAL